MTTKHTITGPSIIRHRVNTIEELHNTPIEYGIEFDIREGQHGIVVTHDPWTTGVSFDTFIAQYRHSFCIVNVKSEGIEYEALRILKTNGIEKFFLLDCSFPMIVRLSKCGERRIAVRVSEYESVETAICMNQHVDWIWLDNFEKLPSVDRCMELKNAGFRICLVSPELQCRNDSALYLSKYIDAVCTKTPELWL
jgi:hypothetical protein